MFWIINMTVKIKELNTKRDIVYFYEIAENDFFELQMYVLTWNITTEHN